MLSSLQVSRAGYPTSDGQKKLGPLYSPSSVADHLKLGIRAKSKDGLVFVVCKSRQDDDDDRQHVRIVPVIGPALSDLAVAFGVLLNTAQDLASSICHSAATTCGRSTPSASSACGSRRRFRRRSIRS